MKKRFIAVVLIFAELFVFASCKSNDGAKADKTATATFLVECNAAINSEELPDEIRSLLPSDGVIFPTSEVTFTEGESVFDITQRELKNAGIHMEASFTPGFDSAYVEGIANLYEFDCGPLSGWLYRVNGEYPGVGCSSAYPEDGDTFEWVYTCNLGEDVMTEQEDEEKIEKNINE